MTGILLMTKCNNVLKQYFFFYLSVIMYLKHTIVLFLLKGNNVSKTYNGSLFIKCNNVSETYNDSFFN